jgi:hypothetical protein
MAADPCELLEQTHRSEGPGTVFELLIRTAREQKNYFQLFEARLMQKRHALGLPLLYSGVISDLPPEHQPAYSAALMDAAREAGGLFLADGDIERAWPYFRAVGDPAPVAAAIETLPSCEGSGEGSCEGIERVIEIALHEGVNPRKGFELFIEQRGLCSSVELATRTSDPARRRMFLQVLIRAIHAEVLGRLKEAIAAREGTAPQISRIPELIAGRDWLFDGGHYYTENSHLASVVQASPELEDEETLSLALELAEYALHLAPMFHFPGNPPFENLYQDHAQYLRAVLGQDAGVQHFRLKLDASVPGSAEVLAGLLSRLGRYEEAIQVSVEHLEGRSAIELCQMAGDYRRLCDVAREQGDPLAFAAGLIQS